MQFSTTLLFSIAAVVIAAPASDQKCGCNSGSSGDVTITNGGNGGVGGDGGSGGSGGNGLLIGGAGGSGGSGGAAGGVGNTNINIGLLTGDEKKGLLSQLLGGLL